MRPLAERYRALVTAGVLLVAMADAGEAGGGRIFTVSADGFRPGIAKDPRGGFGVGWVSGALSEIFARRYGPDDRALTDAVAVGSYDYYSLTVSVAAVGPERYWVAWDSYGKYAGASAQARMFAPQAPLGPPIPVGLGPSLAAAGRNGEWAIAAARAPGLVAQFRSARGARLATVALGKADTWRAATGEGRTAWIVATMHGGIVASQIAADGRLLRALPVSPRRALAVAAGNPSGNLVVAWAGDGFISARWLRSAGTGLGAPVRVAAIPVGAVPDLSAAMDAEGKALIVWSLCCTSPGVSGRRFERGGAPSGPVIPLAGDIPAFSPAVAASRANDFTLVWADAQGVRGQSLAWARPGDELCLFAAGRWRCDVAHDGGQAELRQVYGGAQPATALLGDFDGEGRDDFCLVRSGRLACDTAHDEGAAELKLPLPAGDGDLLAGDLDGEGRDDLCLFRAGRLECDTAHDGGSAEVVVDLETRGGAPLIGDWDGDGDDDPCAAAGGTFVCDLGHDGRADVELTLAARGDETSLLGDVDGDGRSDPCLYEGERLRCDTRHAGRADFEVVLASSGETVLFGNPDGI